MTFPNIFIQNLPAGSSLELSKCNLAESSSSAKQIKKLRLALKTASLVFVDKMLATMTSTKPSLPKMNKLKHVWYLKLNSNRIPYSWCMPYYQTSNNPENSGI